MKIRTNLPAETLTKVAEGLSQVANKHTDEIVLENKAENELIDRMVKLFKEVQASFAQETSAFDDSEEP